MLPYLQDWTVPNRDKLLLSVLDALLVRRVADAHDGCGMECTFVRRLRRRQLQLTFGGATLELLASVEAKPVMTVGDVARVCRLGWEPADSTTRTRNAIMASLTRNSRSLQSLKPMDSGAW